MDLFGWSLVGCPLWSLLCGVRLGLGHFGHMGRSGHFGLGSLYPTTFPDKAGISVMFCAGTDFHTFGQPVVLFG